MLRARAQHEIIHYDQLRACGFSGFQIRSRAAKHELWEVQPFVYTLGLRDLDVLGSLSAAVLAAGDETGVARRSAGLYYRVVDRYNGPIELASSRDVRVKLKKAVARQVVFYPGELVTTDDNIRITSLARTVLDLAGVLTFDELSQAFQKAMSRGLEIAEIEQVYARHLNAKGRGKLRRLIERHREDKGVGRGGFENAFYPWLKSWLPERFQIQRNVDIPFEDGVTRQADFLIGDVWIEVDHYGHHAGAGPKKATEDLQRDRIVGKHYKLGRYTDWEFKNDRVAIRAHIEELLGLDG